MMGVVLHKGCAYGAPFFISWTRHRKPAAQDGGILGTLIPGIDREERRTNPIPSGKSTARSSRR